MHIFNHLFFIIFLAFFLLNHAVFFSSLKQILRRDMFVHVVVLLKDLVILTKLVLS